MVKIVNVLKASGLYTALIFTLYAGAIFPQQGRSRALAPGREAEMIGSKYGVRRGSLSRTATEASLASSTGQHPYVEGGGGGLASVKGAMMGGGLGY